MLSSGSDSSSPRRSANVDDMAPTAVATGAGVSSLPFPLSRAENPPASGLRSSPPGAEPPLDRVGAATGLESALACSARWRLSAMTALSCCLNKSRSPVAADGGVAVKVKLWFSGVGSVGGADPVAVVGGSGVSPTLSIALSLPGLDANKAVKQSAEDGRSCVGVTSREFERRADDISNTL